MGFRRVPAAAACAIGLVIWFVIPVPEGVAPNAWHLLALFVATIAAIIGKAMPIGALSMLAIALVALTQVTSDKPVEAINDALSSFANPLIWLIGVAIMISRALIKTGLGARIAYGFVAIFGKRTLGIGYALAPAELTIAPIINQVLRDCAGPLPEPDPIHAAILFFLDGEVHDRVPVGRPEADGCGSAGPFNPGVREWRHVCSTRLPLRQCFP